MSDTQRLPNLYQLLGLQGLESNRERIVASLKRAQAKIESLKADSARAGDAARLQKVVALGQKYLLQTEQKAAYDAQWQAIYGTAAKPASESVATTVVATASSSTSISPSAAASTPRTTPTVPRAAASKLADDELHWDMSSLDALLPSADPLAPFQMADVLRTSPVRDPLAAEADLRKLIELLGGELAPTSQAVTSQPIDMNHLAASTPAMPVEAPPTLHLASDVSASEVIAEEESASLGIAIPRSSNSAAGAGLAKRMRRKKQRAILLGGLGLSAAVGGLVLLAFYLNQSATKSNSALAQATSAAPRSDAPAVKNQSSEDQRAEAPSADKKSALPPVPGFGTDLIQPGENVKPLEIQARPMTPEEMAAMPDMKKPDMAKPEMAKPDMAKPAEPTKPETDKPEPTKPEPTKPVEPIPAPTGVEATKPAEPPADVKLTPKDKKAWQEDMKRIRAGLSKLDPVASDKQIADATPLAKTALQRAQLATLEQAIGLIRKAREALVAGIGGLESAQTFKVGNSTEVAFVEGDDTHLVVRLAGGRQEYRLDSIPPAMAISIMKLKPNVVDANLDAAMGAYIMVQPKKNSSLSNQGKKLLEEAASAGAISQELAQFHEEDYSLK